MRIDKGNVINADGDNPALESALWCKRNSVSELDPAYPRQNRQNEKWFMRIDKGNVIDADGEDPSLESALWCKPNSVSELDPAYRPQKCEIKTIMDAGSYTKFKRMLEGK